MNSTTSGSFARSLLVVEDDNSQARKVGALLRSLKSRLHIVDNDRDAVQTVAKDPEIALIIVSAELAGRDACDFVHRLRESSGESMLPVLFLTGPDNGAFDLEAVFALGAVDEVPRTRLTWALPVKVRFLLDSDVRSHLQRERALAQLADALAEKHRRECDFLATLAHELHTPLAPMRNGLELMRLVNGDPTELEEVRGMMSRQLDHLAYLVDDLLDVTHLTHDKLVLKKEWVDLRTILATALETARPFVEASENTLTVDISDESMPINADPVRIAQIVINLLNNAAKYTPPGGRIRVTAATHCGEVHLSVSDTGIGIPERALTSVFEMFTQARLEHEHIYDGLGVGLALAQRLLALHGGTIDALSLGLGQGSTFRIRLPRAQAEALPLESEVARLYCSLTGPFRMLIVDDHADARSNFARILDQEQHVTYQARDGTEALAVAAQFQPDIIFLDIGLPDINGRILAPQLRELTGLESVVLVALTRPANARDLVLSAAVGIDHHLNKSTRVQAVRDLLDEIAVTHPQLNEKAGRKIGDPTIDDLNDCIGTSRVALCIADALHPDQPLIVANRAFTDLTGYPVTDVIGRNCRFLQGRNRDQEGRRLIANAIREGRDIEVFLHNVKQSGESFSNLVRLYMVRDAAGVTRYILGSQLEARPITQSAPSLSNATSETCVDVLEQRHADIYPTRLPRRYWSLYDSSRRIADEAAVRLRERVALI